MSQLNTSLSIISDNWLLQNAAEIINGYDENEIEAHWVDVGKHGELTTNSVPRASIQFECLVSLIEQIVFCDRLEVMGNWTHAWDSMSPEFGLLLQSGLVREFVISEEDNESYVSPYVRLLSANPNVAAAYDFGVETLKNNMPNFIGQVVNGIMPYLGYANMTNSVYTPHPVRHRFIQRTLNKASYDISSYAMLKLNERIDLARIRYSKMVGPGCESSSITCRFPSIAIHCLLESPRGISPIKTALQMRESSEFKSLRITIHEFQKAVTTVGASESKYIRAIEAAIQEVERKLCIRNLTEADGFSEITTFQSLPIKIPDALRAPVIAPKHTTALFKLISTGKVKLRQLLKDSLGISDPAVVEGLAALANVDQVYEGARF